MAAVQRIDCSACKQEQTMAPARIPRMSAPVVVIGWILLVPSIISVCFFLLMLLGSFSAGAEATAAAASEAERAGAAIGTGLAAGTSIGGMVCSFVSGLLGYLLIMKKSVYRCDRCGFVLDRA